jgi:Holliday junction resolvase RusA-like endonuclease
MSESYFTITVPGEPVSKGRPRVSQGHAYTDPKTVAAEDRLKWLFRATHVVANTVDDLSVIAVFRCGNRQRKDLDNLVKLLLDAANGIVWRDDMQVVEIQATVLRAHAEPGIDFTVGVFEDRGRFCAKCAAPLTTRQDIYCSKNCYDNGQRKGIYRVCAGCGASVYRQVGKAEAKVVFCTPECLARSRGFCRQCGNQMAATRGPSSGHVFCGAACASVWYRGRTLRAAPRRQKACRYCGNPCSPGAIRCRSCWITEHAARKRSGAFPDQIKAELT